MVNLKSQPISVFVTFGEELKAMCVFFVFKNLIALWKKKVGTKR